MMKKLALFLIMAAMVATPVLGSSENSVDRKLAVKDDYTFEPGKAFATLRIEEAFANEFANDPVSFELKIANAKWFETGQSGDPAVMESDAKTLSDPDITIERISDRILQITLDRQPVAAGEKAWWKIPIYAEVTGAGVVSLEVDGMDGLVSSGTYTIAEAHGDNYLSPGMSFTPDNQQWMTIREPSANAFDATETFRLVLENGTWYPDNDSRLGVQAMLKNVAVSGIEAGSAAEIKRINDKTIEVTVKRGAGSSEKAVGVWSIPLYFKVSEFGLAKVSVEDAEGKAVAGALSKEKVVESIRYIKTVTLTLNQTGIVTNYGSEERSVTLDVTPVNPSGSTMIPVRGVFEQLGGQVRWNSTDRTVTIEAEGKQIVIQADSSGATLNGKTITLSERPLIINGRLLIPLRSVSEQLGFGVEWLEAAQKIIIRQD